MDSEDEEDEEEERAGRNFGVGGRGLGLCEWTPTSRRREIRAVNAADAYGRSVGRYIPEVADGDRRWVYGGSSGSHRTGLDEARL